MLAPATTAAHKSSKSVAHLRFKRQLGFRHGSHSNEISSLLTTHERLGMSRKLWPLCAGASSLLLTCCVVSSLGSSLELFAKTMMTAGASKLTMGSTRLVKEGQLPTKHYVDKLIDERDMA